MGLNGKQLLENFKEDEAYGNTTYTPPANDNSSEDDNGDNAWKYISASDIRGLADYTNRNYNYRTIPFLGQIVGHAADAATQGVADVAQFVGAQGIGDYFNEKAQKGEAELPAMSTPELSLAYLTDPNGLASAFGMMTGSMLSIIPVAAIAPELLPVRAAMALSKVSKALSAVPKIGGALEEMAPMAGRFALTGPVEAMMEGGNTEREMLQNGATPEEARQAAWDVFGENVGLLTATNALEGGLLGKIKIKTPHFSNPVANTASRIAGYAPTTAAEMALQGYEEGAQQGIQDGVEGESPNTANQILNPFAWTDDQWDAAKFGAAGAVPLMGAMGAIRHFGNRGDNGSTAADSLLDQAQDDIDSITSQTAQQSVIQSAQQDMENNPYTASTAMQDTSYEAPSGTSDTSSGSSYDASALEGDPQYTVSGEVSSTDVTPLTDQKMRLLDSAYYNKYGQHLFVTSMKRNGDGGSWHDSGQAFDTADDNLENNKEARDWLINEGEKLGLTPLDEYEHPSAGATGGHIHFSDHGEPIPDGIRVDESDSDMDDSDMDDSTGGVDLSNLPVGDIAMDIAQNTNLPVNFIWSQLSHESDGGKSKLAVEDHNYGGVKGNDGEYLHFDNDQQFIDYMSKYYPKYREDGIYDAKTADQFAEALQHGGYFTADLGEYEGGMHRYLEQAGLSQDAMFGGKARRAGRKGGDSTSSTPDLSGSFEISADDPAMDSMFASFAKDWQNMSTDANEINFFGDMFNSRNKFKATEENKQAILDNYGDAFRQYVQENQPQTVQTAQTAQAPNIQTAASPKMEAAAIQNVLSSFAQDKKNVARTEQEANLFDDMLDADDHFIDTPKNRQTLLKNYGAQLQNYVDDVMTPSLDDRVNQAIEQAVQNKDLNRMNILTQAKQANDTATLEKLVGPQTKQHVDIAAMLTPANTDVKNHVSSMMQGNAPAASQHAPRTIQAATTARLGNMVSEITSGNTYKNASPVGKLAYLSAASAHAKTIGADKSARAIDSIIADVRKKAGFSGKGTTEGMTPEQKDEFYNAFYKQSLDDATAIRKEAADEKPANLKSLDNTIEMFKQELAKSKPTKEERKEVTHESTQSKSQNAPDKGTKNQDQHTKPETRKAADTQRKAEESEVSATKKAADKGGRDEQTLSEKEVVLKHISTLFGKPITNKETGIVATFGTKGANKMVSNKAVDKTVKNGYSQHEHLEAVKDIKRLYEDAGLSVQHEDRDKSPNILSIKRFRTNMTTVDGNPATAKITVKETKQNGHKIYSIELEALEKPSELNHARADSSEGQTVRPTKGKQPSSAYADESSSSTHIIPHEQKEGTNNLDSAKVPAMGEPIHGIKGTETTVVTDSGKEIRVRYLVVPASRVITSHNAETMTPNKAYPQELQPRDRQRVSMQEQVTSMANELRPADLGAGRNLNQGAPIIRNDGVVLNGNGRAMAIQKATAAGGDKATAYRKYIFEHSKEFGLSRVNLAQVRKYMLVREVVDDIDADTMQDIIGSTTGGSRMGASEQAKADAKKIKPRDLERYVDNEQGDLTTAANQDFVAGILYRIVSKNERNAYTDEHGNVNADGIQRVKRALFSLAYDDDGLIDKMAESTDDNIRNVSRGLMNAAPAFARVNLAVADGQAYPYNADKTVSEAVKRLDALRSEGKPVKDYLNEQSMFSEYQDTDEMRDVLRFFDDNKRSGKKIGIFLNDIANSIMMQGDPNQTSLMNGERATLGDIIKTSARVASNGTSSADLFADVQEAPTKAKENTTQAKDKSTAPNGETHYSAEARTDHENTEDTAYMEQVDRYQNAATPEEKQAALKSLQDMVRKAAEDAGFTDAVPEQTVAYKTRTKAAPRKTVKVYKVFTVSPDGSPTALFIGGTEKLPQGVWLDAQPAYHFKAKNGLYYVPSTKNPYTKGGKTGATVEIPNEKVRQELIERGFLAEGSKAQKVTALAYRPGWHAGTLPFFPQGGMRPPKGMNTSYKNIHRYNQVVFECELAADKDYTHEAEQQPKARNKDGSLNTKKADLQYLPENGYYYYATNPMTHGHPELGLWAISGSLKINRALTQEECDDILKKQGMEPQPWEGGKMNLEDLGYHGAENDAARKTLAPITYDDDGNVIPLSQRFNREIDDIRYSAKQNDAQVKRSLQAVVDEAKKAFPNAKNIRQDGGHISMDMPNGAEVQINVVPSIEVNNEEAGRARAAHGLKDDVRIKINGGERTVGRTALIELSQLGRKGTAYHEAFHAVYDMCLTNEEKAALHKAYDKEAKAKGRDVYEVMADKYRDWMLAQQKEQHTLFGKPWQKVKSAVIRLLHLIRGADNARDVFRKVGSGEVWERQLNFKDSGNRYLVTNDQIRPDTEVPIIDVTDEPKVNVNNHHAAADIARSMIGKTFRIIGSDGYGKIASVSDGTHFVHSSNNPVRFNKTRRKALSVAEKILGNCVYIEKHGDLKHGTKQSYIEMFSVVKDGNRLVRFRIVAKEGNKDSHAFRIGEAKFYDIIKDGALQESGVLRHYKHEGTPSTLTIAELLKGVKDREGHLYVNKDGSLNYDTRIFHNGEEQGGSPSDVRNSADLFAIRPGEPIRYSLDANDNSKPSLFTRAYNHLTGRKNAASHDKNVKAMLEDITKMRVRFGKLDPKTETVFKKFEGVIRARNANEWEKVLPEAGRAIADRLNLKPSEDMNNYIAKWLLDEATNDTSQEASDFAAALKNDPVLSDQLVDLKTLFNERNNREADEVVRDAIQYEKPKERTTLTKAWETFYDEMIEELGPVKRMVKRVQEKSGQELAASVNPYIALRLFRGNAGRAMTMIEGQSEAAVKALQTNYPGVNFNGFKTLHMILDECGALHNEKRMKDFLAFALACHVKDIHTLNNRIRKSQQRLRDKIADLNDKINNLPEYQQLIESDKKVDDKHQEQREAYQKEIEGYQAKIDKAEKTIMEVPRTEDGLSLTEDRCNKVMMKYMKEYGEAQQDLVHFSKVTTSILYDAGVISKKRYKELQERWPNYIPMFRVFEDNEEVDFGDSLKHMHGSTRRIINPLDSIIRNTYDFVKKAEKNKARQLLANLTRISDVGEYIEEVDNSKPNDKTTITFYENGERKYLQTDPDIVKAVNNMGREESNWVLRLLHGPTKIARACFTTINPSFALRNIIRDSTDATIYSKYGFKPWDFVRGFLHAVHRDELFYEWLSSGAAQASAISLDRDYTQATLNQMSKTWKERLLSKEFLPAILEGMQMVGEYSEYGTRIAAYERVKKTLAGENGPHPAAYDLVSAAFESRDLMDFARGGRGSRHLNNVVVFANASIQGFDKFFRTFDFRKPYRKESMKALARLFLCGMLPALLLAGIHSGDDWWEELPDWQKETNWILGKVGNTIIRIPKGQDIGLRFFSNLIEKAMDRSKHKAGDYFRPVWDSLPDMIPTALLPIIEATANHSYFTGAPVVPKYQEKLPAYLQFGNETSSFAKFVGKVIGVSPRKVEHVLFGYTGNMGKGLLGVYDTIVGNQSLNTNLNEAPVISGFTAIPYKQSKTVNDFYDKFDEQQRLNEEFKLTKKKPDGYDPSLYKRMTKAQQELSKINKQERAAIDDPKMDSGVREQKQLGYQQRRLSVVRKVMGQ